jgi:hypothetical protein
VRALLEIQLDVLLERDCRGRLVATRDPSPRPAPRLFLGRSAEGNVFATRRDLDPATHDALGRLCSAEPRLDRTGPEWSPACRARVLEILGPAQAEHRGPCYVLPDRLPHDARAREIAAGERAAFGEAFAWLAGEFESVAPVAIAFEDDRPAAICHSPRGVTDRAAEAGVETLELFRGRGLATAAVACWARAVQRAGRLALYSTAWDNRPSQAIARRLSARLYGECWHVT